jgi:2,5-diketo-D-gluconate reductase A
MVRMAVMLLPVAFAADMPTREVVPGVEMPFVSIGTWVSGTTTSKEDPKQIVKNWLGQGFRGIDTAWDYFDQPAIAEAIAESGVAREDLFITTKIPACMSEQAAGWVEDDLSQLKTDYIDLLLIHGPIGLPGACPRTWKVLEEYVASGKLKSIGVSNFNRAQMQRIMDMATVPIAVNQIEYNVFSHDEDTIKFCDENGITVESWSPLNGGHGGASVFQDEVVTAIAQQHNVSNAQVALRWVVQSGH